jgi:hypothetical protein
MKIVGRNRRISTHKSTNTLSARRADVGLEEVKQVVFSRLS